MATINSLPKYPKNSCKICKNYTCSYCLSNQNNYGTKATSDRNKCQNLRFKNTSGPLLFNKNYQKTFIKRNYLHIIDFITKKINKKSISIENIKSKIDKDNISDKLKDFSTCKIVNYLSS